MIKTNQYLKARKFHKKRLSAKYLIIITMRRSKRLITIDVIIENY